MFLQEYEKIRMIGKGAFASVFKVRHAKLGYVRALKVCDSFIEDENDRAWQTFLAECKVLLRIGNGSHPNIVKIFQPRLIDNHAVVEMDCVEGDSLHSYIKQNQFIPIEEFYRFAKQIISALAYCHVDVYKFLMNPLDDKLEIDPNDGRKYIVSPEKEKELIKKYGVVHNDLHSGNIIRRDYDGQYILLDFGLAIQDSHCVKSSSRFDGAIEYCSPEKLENGTISTQSDVYALGILLYEMLTGRVPFPYSNEDGSTPESARSRVYLQHLQDTPPSIFELRKQAFEATHPGETYTQDYPEQLEAMIMKCLAKSPEDRFRNAKELNVAFNKLMEDNSSDSSMSELNKIKEEMAELRSQLQAEKGKIKPGSETAIPNQRFTKETSEAKNTGKATWTIQEKANNQEKVDKEKVNKKHYYRIILWTVGLIIGGHLVRCVFTYYHNVQFNENLTVAEDTIPIVMEKNTEPKHINDFEWVDLGLSVLWATCNVGANSPEEPGSYVAWGDTCTKSVYSESTCKTYKKNIGDISGNKVYDVAALIEGSSRMPSLSEYQELLRECEWTWNNYNGVDGYFVKSRHNGNHIFLPITGYIEGCELIAGDTSGYYWTSTPNREKNTESFFLVFCKGEGQWCSSVTDSKPEGMCVRPVKNP